MAETFCKEFHNDEDFNPSNDDFKDKVNSLCKAFRSKIAAFNEEGKDENNG